MALVTLLVVSREAFSNAAITSPRLAGGFGIGCEKSIFPLSAMSTRPCSITKVHASSFAERDRSCGL